VDKVAEGPDQEVYELPIGKFGTGLSAKLSRILSFYVTFCHCLSLLTYDSRSVNSCLCLAISRVSVISLLVLLFSATLAQFPAPPFFSAYEFFSTYVLILCPGLKFPLDFLRFRPQLLISPSLPIPIYSLSYLPQIPNQYWFCLCHQSTLLTMISSSPLLLGESGVTALCYIPYSCYGILIS
jgi:hypothetical protein